MLKLCWRFYMYYDFVSLKKMFSRSADFHTSKQGDFDHHEVEVVIQEGKKVNKSSRFYILKIFLNYPTAVTFIFIC